MDNGEQVETFEHIETDQILIDGNNSGDIGDLVLKDREMLASSGIVIISCTLDKETKRLSREVIENNIEENQKRIDYAKIKNDVRDVLGKFFYQETEAKPMVITVIQEV